MRMLATPKRRRFWMTVALVLLAWAAPASARAAAVPAAEAPEAVPQPLTLETAVGWALTHNPELAALRAQHGIAVAAIVIAQTYPFNPAWEGKVLPVNGPTSAGITNRVFNEHKLLLDVELHHQRRYREAAAAAGLTRTDWEIANQEVTLAVRVSRAFDTVLYREAKLSLIDDTLRLNEDATEQVRKLFEAGRLRSADLLLARTEVIDTRALALPARTALTSARYDLLRALGLVDGGAALAGTLEMPPVAWDAAKLLETALECRSDLNARRRAVDEAEARLQLAIADRHGNPNLGPMYEFDPTSINYIGAQFTLPIPVFNRHKGEILQREADRTRAGLEVRQFEVQVQQDVQAALARLANAEQWVDFYRTKTLPELQNTLKELQKLFEQADPAVDVLRLLDVRRRLIHARDGYLDALWELRQAQADLAAAAGDPRLLLGPQALEEKPPLPRQAAP
jgi:cobalt-zinc-cadmium efflux system outer membrane protein